MEKNQKMNYQEKCEEELSNLNYLISKINKQLTEVDYYISVADRISANIKCEYLLKAVNELYSATAPYPLRSNL